MEPSIIHCYFGGERREEIEGKKESKNYLDTRVKYILIFPNLEFNFQKANYQQSQQVTKMVTERSIL